MPNEITPPAWSLHRTDKGTIILLWAQAGRDGEINLGPAEEALTKLADFLELNDFGEVAPR